MSKPGAKESILMFALLAMTKGGHESLRGMADERRRERG
jgi:hypothetical protein